MEFIDVPVKPVMLNTRLKIGHFDDTYLRMNAVDTICSRDIAGIIRKHICAYAYGQFREYVSEMITYAHTKYHIWAPGYYPADSFNLHISSYAVNISYNVIFDIFNAMCGIINNLIMRMWMRSYYDSIFDIFEYINHSHARICQIKLSSIAPGMTHIVIQ